MLSLFSHTEQLHEKSTLNKMEIVATAAKLVRTTNVSLQKETIAVLQDCHADYIDVQTLCANTRFIVKSLMCFIKTDWSR